MSIYYTSKRPIFKPLHGLRGVLETNNVMFAGERVKISYSLLTHFYKSEIDHVRVAGPLEIMKITKFFLHPFKGYTQVFIKKD